MVVLGEGRRDGRRPFFFFSLLCRNRVIIRRTSLSRSFHKLLEEEEEEEGFIPNQSNDLDRLASAACSERLGDICSGGPFPALLRLCGEARSEPPGRLVHASLVRSGCDSDPFLVNRVLQMYTRCGAVGVAGALFERMVCDRLSPPPMHDAFTWNTMISAHAAAGEASCEGNVLALALFRRMLENRSIKPNRFTFPPVLASCARVGALAEGRLAHSVFVTSLFSSDPAVQTSLISMYGRCHHPFLARSVFNRMCCPDIASHNAIIAAYAQNGLAQEALAIFRELPLRNLKPTKITFLHTLDACATLGSVEQAHIIRKQISVSGFDLDTTVNNALIHAYSKCGSLKEACHVFDEMHRPNVISWNSIIAVLAHNGMGMEALEFFQRMSLEGFSPTKATLLSVLDACADTSSLDFGRLIHDSIVSSGFDSDTAVMTSLVNMYGKCGSLKDARAVFERILRRDEIAWTAVIVAYSQNGHIEEALELLKRMELEGGVRPTETTFAGIIDASVENGHGKKALELFFQMSSRGTKLTKITFLNVLNACACLESLENGKLAHGYAIGNGFESNLAVKTALLNMYGKCHSLKVAETIFEGMRERDVISWNSMISAYAVNGKGIEAIELFRQMCKRGIEPTAITFLSVLDACSGMALLEAGREIHEHIIGIGLDSDVAIGNALVNMYGKCGCLKDAIALFEKMHRRNVISWTSMIATYSQNNRGEEALKLFWEMVNEGVKPSKVTFLTVLEACCSLGSKENGQAVHECLISLELGFDIALQNALVNMYGKCGSPKDARAVFDEMSDRDLISWNSMIAAYVRNDCGKEALELFRRMSLEGVDPDGMTFVNVLSACASLQCLEHGWEIHGLVQVSRFKSDVAVRNALVDMYGKCGSAKDARLVFNSMQHRTVISWSSMIAAYAQNGRGDEALELFRWMSLEDVKPNEITLLCALNACSHAGLLNEGRYHFNSMSRNHNLSPSVKHYVCMIDLLGRAGFLDEAEDLVNNMPFRNDASPWTSLLGACRVHGDAERGARVAKHVIKLEPHNASTYVLLSNIYAAAGRWDEAIKVRKALEGEVLDQG